MNRRKFLFGSLVGALTFGLVELKAAAGEAPVIKQEGHTAPHSNILTWTFRDGRVATQEIFENGRRGDLVWQHR